MSEAAGHDLFGTLDHMNGYYQARRITNTTTVIGDVTGTQMYLVEGRRQAMLIDTGSGLPGLPALVRSLTDKPVSVLLTHGHCDHASGSAWFDSVYLHRADQALTQQHTQLPMRRAFVRFWAPARNTDAIPDEEWCPPRTDGFLTLEDGQIFDLGSVLLEAVCVPGHTQGMTCVLNREERTILYGDACHTQEFLWLQESSSVEEYLESLGRLDRMKGLYDTAYLSHHIIRAPRRLLEGVEDVCREVLAGRSDEEPFEFLGMTGLLRARRANLLGKRLDGGIGNIIYRKDRVFRGSKG